jgi:hypothetical protein
MGWKETHEKIINEITTKLLICLAGSKLLMPSSMHRKRLFHDPAGYTFHDIERPFFLLDSKARVNRHPRHTGQDLNEIQGK